MAGGPHYAGKPRPVLVIQDDHYDATESITICPLTTDDLAAPLFRVAIPANPQTGLHHASYAMVDKLTTVRRTKLGEVLGRVANKEMVAVDRAIVVFLGLAG